MPVAPPKTSAPGSSASTHPTRPPTEQVPDDPADDQDLPNPDDHKDPPGSYRTSTRYVYRYVDAEDGEEVWVDLDLTIEEHSFRELNDLADEDFTLSMSRVALVHTRNEKVTPDTEIEVEERDLLIRESTLPVEIVQQEMEGASVESSSEESEERLAGVPPTRIDMDDPEVTDRLLNDFV